MAAAVLSVCGASSTVFAATPFPTNTLLSNPAAAGTSYNTVLPGWITPANLIASQDAPLSQDFGGTLTSRVYYLDASHDPLQGLGFTYVFHVNVADDHSGGFPDSLDIPSFSSRAGERLDHRRRLRRLRIEPWRRITGPLTNGQPLNLRRFAYGHPKINWDGFDGAALWAGDTSAVLFFAANQPGYQLSLASLADSNAIGTASTYAP